MNIGELLLFLNPEDEVRYESDKFKLSVQILELEHKKCLSTTQAAQVVGLSIDEFMKYELGVDELSYLNYLVVINKLENYIKEE